MDEVQYTSKRTEERIINGRKSIVTVWANTPSQTAIKRYAETMTRIVQQMEERENRI